MYMSVKTMVYLPTLSHYSYLLWNSTLLNREEHFPNVKLYKRLGIVAHFWILNMDVTFWVHERLRKHHRESAPDTMPGFTIASGLLHFTQYNVTFNNTVAAGSGTAWFGVSIL